MEEIQNLTAHTDKAKPPESYFTLKKPRKYFIHYENK